MKTLASTLDTSQRQSRKMTDAEWNSIKIVCLHDTQRMSLFNQLTVIHAKCDTDSCTMRDVDLWHDLKERLLDREWQILAEYSR